MAVAVAVAVITHLVLLVVTVLLVAMRVMAWTATLQVEQVAVAQLLLLQEVLLVRVVITLELQVVLSLAATVPMVGTIMAQMEVRIMAGQVVAATVEMATKRQSVAEGTGVAAGGRRTVEAAPVQFLVMQVAVVAAPVQRLFQAPGLVLIVVLLKFQVTARIQTEQVVATVEMAAQLAEAVLMVIMVES